MSVLPVTQIAPGSFVLKRGANGCSTTAPAVAGTMPATSSASRAIHLAMVRKIRRARLFPCLLARFRSVGREIRAGSTSPGDGA